MNHAGFSRRYLILRSDVWKNSWAGNFPRYENPGSDMPPETGSFCSIAGGAA